MGRDEDLKGRADLAFWFLMSLMLGAIGCAFVFLIYLM